MKTAAPLYKLLPDTPLARTRIRIIDIGANPIDGSPPYTPLVVSGRADIVGFEPNRAALAMLMARKGRHETYLPHAVGDGRRHTLHFCQAPGMTSLLRPNEAVLKLFHGFSEWGRVTGTAEIDTVRLDDIPEAHGTDYVKIDVQGAELMVFENAPELLADVVLIHTEVEFLPLYEGQPLFSDVDKFLRDKGFVLHRFEPLVSRAMKPLMVEHNPYAPFRQVMWADAVFIRSFLDLGSLTDHHLLKLATILHDCYQSFDLVHLLLAEYDRRCAGTTAGTYLEALLS